MDLVATIIGYATNLRVTVKLQLVSWFRHPELLAQRLRAIQSHTKKLWCDLQLGCSSTSWTSFKTVSSTYWLAQIAIVPVNKRNQSDAALIYGKALESKMIVLQFGAHLKIKSKLIRLYSGCQHICKSLPSRLVRASHPDFGRRNSAACSLHDAGCRALCVHPANFLRLKPIS